MPLWLPFRGEASGTVFPAAPLNDDVYVYVADGANGVYWRFKYRAATGRWVFVGGSSLFAEVAAAEGLPADSDATYRALATPGPSIALPFAGDYGVEIGARITCATQASTVAPSVTRMSYDIGGTGAIDADGIDYQIGAAAGTLGRPRRKNGLGAVTLTAKYSHDAIGTGYGGLFVNRWMRVWPVQK